MAWQRGWLRCAGLIDLRRVPRIVAPSEERGAKRIAVHVQDVTVLHCSISTACAGCHNNAVEFEDAALHLSGESRK